MSERNLGGLITQATLSGDFIFIISTTGDESCSLKGSQKMSISHSSLPDTSRSIKTFGPLSEKLFLNGQGEKKRERTSESSFPNALKS